MSRNTFEPYIRTPISDMLGPVVSSQRKPCRDFELRLNKCKEAFGKTMGEKKCMDYLEDYNECCNQFKQVIKYDQMIYSIKY